MSETNNIEDKESLKEIEEQYKLVKRVLKRVGVDFNYVDQAIQRSENDDWYDESAFYWTRVMWQDVENLKDLLLQLHEIRGGHHE